MLQPSADDFDVNLAGHQRFYLWQRTGEPAPTADAIEQARGWLAQQFEKAERVRVGDGDTARFS
jgi:hypothetical protein